MPSDIEKTVNFMEQIQSLKSVTLADRVEDSLLHYIRRTGLKPGEVFPKEEELASRLNVSRHIVREGISRLKTLGLIESRRHRGMVLTRPDTFGTVAKLARAKIFTENEYAEFVQLRAVMELGMVDFIYERKTPEAIAELRKIASVSTNSCYSDEDERLFHGKLFTIGGNRIADKFREVLASVFNHSPKLGEKSSAPALTPTHQDICDALEYGSCEKFRETMKQHLTIYF